MATNPLLKLKEAGQSVWMDHLDRGIIESGELKQMISEQGIAGITSNPAIFQKAISGSDLYNPVIEEGIKDGKSPQEIYEMLIFEDIRNACDIFRSVYDETSGLDGYVSIEVSPHLSRDTEATLNEARRFYKAIGRENVMIKIPGTPEGFPAVEQAIAEGINVNITLLFSVDSYLHAAEAYIRGLERRVKEGKPIDKLASVASFFLSRIDTNIDDRLDNLLQKVGIETLNDEAQLSQIKGKIAIANAKIAYQEFKKLTASDRWKALAAKGANVQRLLWASTSTKNPDYSDVMYVDELVGQDTVNTLPPNTIEACADHCSISGNQIESDVEAAYQLIESLKEPEVGIELDQVMDELLEEGIDKFVQPFDSLMKSMEEKVDRLAASRA
ncbi:transaldolase [Egbenema bharatensis]|uniref:transaldolase n=1 Tax=Egbenema bharatensis TaxID=3463334 RepID=UPI003A890770